MHVKHYMHVKSPDRGLLILSIPLSLWLCRISLIRCLRSLSQVFLLTLIQIHYFGDVTYVVESTNTESNQHVVCFVDKTFCMQSLLWKKQFSFYCFVLRYVTWRVAGLTNVLTCPGGLVLVVWGYSIVSLPDPAWRNSARPHCLRRWTSSWTDVPAHSERRDVYVWISGRMFVHGTMDCTQYVVRKDWVWQCLFSRRLWALVTCIDNTSSFLEKYDVTAAFLHP